MTSTDGYNHAGSKAEIDGKFVGLMCDEDNQFQILPKIANLNQHAILTRRIPPRKRHRIRTQHRCAKSFALNAGIVDTVAALQGPEIFWGSEGVLEGFDESDIKGYDNFTKLAAA